MAPVLRLFRRRAEEIADDIVSIDQAMKWGFGWETGPFETWDAIGLEKSQRKMEELKARIVPEWVKDMLADKASLSFIRKRMVSLFYHKGEYHRIDENPKVIILKRLKEQKGVIKKNSGASFDRYRVMASLCLNFIRRTMRLVLTSLQMINAAIDETEKNYKGLVIGNQGKNFCVGANVAMILMEAQDDDII